jgi:phage terminase large subunit-like protein
MVNQAAMSVDRVTKYASDVVAGVIIAGPYVRNACKRHLSDMKDGDARGWRFDNELAQYHIDLFPATFRLTGGDFDAKPFDLLDWQAFVIGSVYGWISIETGLRRFRIAYVETGKGSGKSPLAAGIGLIGLCCEGENAAEVYAAATTKDQAKILFRDAVAMVKASPDLRASLALSGGEGQEWNIAYPGRSSFFRPIATDAPQSGYRPYYFLCDEVHEHRTNAVIEMGRAGFKSRKQPLIFMITNSGTGKDSVCWDYHQRAVNIAGGMESDDRFFGYVCGLDADDDPLNDETCWVKANPSLEAGLPGYPYLREQVAEAKGLPSKESLVRRLCFNQWVEAHSPWLSADVWTKAADTGFDPAYLIGREFVAGLDLSSALDLTAWVRIYLPTAEDPFHRLVSNFWLPEVGLSHKEHTDQKPYLAWKSKGHLYTTPGKTIDKAFVVRQISKDLQSGVCRGIAYDRWRIEELLVEARKDGLELPLHPMGQGYRDMGPAVVSFESMLISGKLKHDGNPVMTSCVASVEINQGPTGDRKLDKSKNTGRIDGAVAGVMASGFLARLEIVDFGDAIEEPIIA